MYPREGGDPVWAPAFAGEQGGLSCHFVEARPAVRSRTHRHSQRDTPERRHPFPPLSRHPSESWDLPDWVTTLANRNTPASAGATSGVSSTPVEVPKTGKDTDTDTSSDSDTSSVTDTGSDTHEQATNNYTRGGIARQSCHGKPRRFRPSHRLSYITPICQRRIMIEAFLPHRSVERRRPDLSADRATPEATPTNQNNRTSERNYAASQPPRRPRATPQKMLRERPYIPHFTLLA